MTRSKRKEIKLEETTKTSDKLKNQHSKSRFTSAQWDLVCKIRRIERVAWS